MTTGTRGAELIDLPDEGSADDERWRELAHEAVEPNPFYEPGVVRAASRHLGMSAPALLVTGNGHGWDACVPVVPRAGRLESWRYVHRFLGTPLVRRDCVEQGVEGLVRGIGARSMLFLHLMAADGPVREALQPFGPVGFAARDRATVRRRARDDYLRSTLRPDTYRELRRQSRQLTEQLGPVELVDRAGDADAPHDFLMLESAGWKGRTGTALAAAGHGAFFVAVCAAFAGDGRLQLVTLRAGEHTLAMGCHLIAGDGIFAFKIAYDEAFRRFSPGIQLEARVPGLLHHHPAARWVDSCAASDNHMINRLWPDRRRVEHVLVPAPTAVGRLARFGVGRAVSWRARRAA